MNEQQRVHIAMLNSYNLVMENATIDDILDSSIPIFAHVPNENITIDAIEFMIYYFKSHEMFEYCAKLKDFIIENFNDDGTLKDNSCKCELPDIDGYNNKIKCIKCNKIIKV
jgi:hypothetical protein